MSDGTPVQANLPWLRTAEGLDKLSFDLEVVSRKALARSFDCTGQAGDDAGPCDFCAHLEPKVKVLAENARTRQPHTRHSLLTPVQLLDIIRERDQNTNTLKLQSLNDGRKIKRLLSTLEDHTSLAMALSQCDVPWLRNLLQTALRNGTSIHTILRMIEEAIERGYRPRGHSQEAIDLAILTVRLGGRNLLYAWNQWLTLPSLRTLRNHMSFVKIIPTIGRISTMTIQENIKNLVIVPRQNAASTKMCGVSMMIDETAQEEAAVYISQLNSVGGLCWMHSNLVDTTLHTYQSALGIAEALKSQKVHVGKEVTVAGAHIFGEEGVYPVLAAPTCKSESAADMEFIFKTILESWDNSGAAQQVGPAWSFATDGDATRRKAGHRTFVHIPLSPFSPLYGTLLNLPGVNLFTGPGEVTLDFDYKHIMKRYCTLLRSRAGMHLNNGRCINATMIERYLVWLPDVDESRARKLVYPNDPQDMPRAVELVGAVIKLASLPNIPDDVNVIADFDAIKLLAEILRSLLNPFIDVNLSLTEQVVHLSRFTHLLFACYRDQRRGLMPNQLYYDSETFAKNAVFCILKQQKLDPSEHFFFLDVGDDALELKFAFLRMCGGHNNAMNYKQVLDRLGAARDIGGVYARNSDLSHGHRRLNLKRADGVDHVSRFMWVGDVVAGHCDLPSAWHQGRDEAISILSWSQIHSSAYDFQTLFSPGSGIDLLCIFGGSRYPAIHEEDDEDISLLAPPPNIDTLQQDVVSSETADTISNDDDEPPLTFEESLADTLDAEHEDGNSLVDEPEDDENSPSPTSPPNGPGIRAEDYLWCMNKWVHKASVVHITITPDFTPKAQTRLLCVRGFTPVNKDFENTMEVGQLLHSDQFVTGDLFITLLRTSMKSLALALVRATTISENGAPRSRVKMATLTSLKGNVKVAGEIMILLPSSSSSTLSWIWNGAYLKTASVVPGTEICTLKVITVTVPGFLVQTVNPRVVIAADHLAPQHTQEVNSKGTTWSLDDEDLQSAVALLWNKTVDSKVPLSLISSLNSESSVFPYKSHDGKRSDALICAAGTELLLTTGRGKTVMSACPVCCESTKDIRSHMGVHILRAARKVADIVVNPINGPLPCGFCGDSNNPDCALTFKETARKIMWESKCPRKETFQYGSANKGSDSRPCHNVPVVCQICVHLGRATDWCPAVWRYNLEAHIDLQHSEYAQPGRPIGLPLPRAVYDSLALTPAEEKKAGVASRPVFEFIQGKENIPGPDGSSAVTQKRKANAQKFSSAASVAKRVRQG
ncbi:hypothetical protein DEU56DRAFT_740233 [Suillus clintonianus]|uniref:uncharacterized protein n=1 Tax=Suillus clintonianus TaxID=1904413 RepID=UPI001B8729B7|nr:uncharacterized protein DEU56DRAFT_740233 [Suillus clintonianus]KAG2131071.1 hypothetical protein DEU56DRAFT_740233 [Suillus clintonianus]